MLEYAEPHLPTRDELVNVVRALREDLLRLEPDTHPFIGVTAGREAARRQRQITEAAELRKSGTAGVDRLAGVA